MKQSLFNTVLVALLVTSAAVAQTKSIYKKSFDTSSDEKFEFQATNVAVTFETSPDDQIHIDFSLEFENYSEKEIEEIIPRIRTSVSILDGFTRFQVSSDKKFSKEQYILNTDEDMVLEYDDLNFVSRKKQFYKSHDSVVNEIQKKSESFLDKVKVKGKDGKRKSLSKSKIRVMRSYFIVKIPQHVYTRVKGMDTQVFIPNDFTQRMDISLIKGLFKAKKIANEQAYLSFDDMASVQIESVQVKNLSMRDITKGLIGSIDQTTCAFKGSRVELGFVGKDIDIRDFSSKIYLYNFDPKFEKLNLKGDYTELYLFDYGEHIELRAEGGDITLNMKEGDESSQFKADMMRKRAKDPIFGQVLANLKNGILHVITNK